MRRYSTFVLATILVGGFTPITEATPVQWLVADGGNGHFYEAFPFLLELAGPTPVNWPIKRVVILLLSHLRRKMISFIT